VHMMACPNVCEDGEGKRRDVEVPQSNGAYFQFN